MNALTVHGITGLISGLLAGISMKYVFGAFLKYKCGKKKIDVPEKDVNRNSVLIVRLICSLSILAVFLMDDLTSAVLLGLVIEVSSLTVLMDDCMRIIPNEAVLFLLVSGIAYNLLNGGFEKLFGSVGVMLFIAVLISAAALAASMIGLSGSVVGAGDMKFLMVSALILGSDNLLWLIAGFAVSVFIFALYKKIATGTIKSTYFPMAWQIWFGLLTGILVPGIMEYVDLIV